MSDRTLIKLAKRMRVHDSVYNEQGKTVLARDCRNAAKAIERLIEAEKEVEHWKEEARNNSGIPPDVVKSL